MIPENDGELPPEYFKWRRDFFTPTRRYSLWISVIVAGFAYMAWFEAASGPYPLPRFDVSPAFPAAMICAELVNGALWLLFPLYWFFAALLVFRLPGLRIWSATLFALLLSIPWLVLDWPDGRATGYQITNHFLPCIWVYLMMARLAFQAFRCQVLDQYVASDRFYVDLLSANPESDAEAMQIVAKLIERELTRSRWKAAIC